MHIAPDLFGCGALSLVRDFILSTQRVGAVDILFFRSRACVCFCALFYQKGYRRFSAD